jgi:hypothetical protein
MFFAGSPIERPYAGPSDRRPGHRRIRDNHDPAAAARGRRHDATGWLDIAVPAAAEQQTTPSS